MGPTHQWVSQGGAVARGASQYLIAALMIFSECPTEDASPCQVLEVARINPHGS